MKKLKICINWAASCGGCDVSVLDVEEKILDLIEIADIIYWPVAMDFKRDFLKSFEPKSIDIGIFNGAVRTSEQKEDAEILREKCKVLIAYGACACYGGIPGLANLANRDEIFNIVYKETPSTENPEFITPKTEVSINKEKIFLPEFFESVYALNQVVDVDYYVPGCPPVREQVEALIEVAKKYHETGELPPKGSVFASEKSLCYECDRNKLKEVIKLDKIHRVHEVIPDERCLLEQGIICLGPITRGGCGQRCINVNMPCRGCFGPLPDMVDPGAEGLSAIVGVFGKDEDYKPPAAIPRVLENIRDVVGTFYRFTLPSSILSKKLEEE